MGDIIIFMDKNFEKNIFQEDLYEIGNFIEPYLVNSENGMSIVEQVKSVVRRLNTIKCMNSKENSYFTK